MLCIQSPLICEGEEPNKKKFKLGANNPKNFEDRYSQLQFVMTSTETHTISEARYAEFKDL
jgi:hypothetical protein